MPLPGWDEQAPPPARGSNRGGQTQAAANHKEPVDPGELAQYDAAWEKAEVRENTGGFVNKPDGTYIGQIGAARLDRTRADGTPMLLISMMILAGPSTGEYNHRRVIRDSDSVKFVKQDMHNLGLDVPLLSALPDYLPSLIDVCVEFVLKTTERNGKTYQNCFLNRSLDPADVDAAIAGAGVADNSEVPF